MIVRQLRLVNFRNYALQSLELEPGLLALTGDNGQGKTNLLEAICVLATTRSPLVERDRELVRWNERAARLWAEIELGAARGAALRQLEYSWRIEGTGIAREMRVGGVPQSAVAQWLGQLQVVSFFPHDLLLITGEPEERRRFLNIELGKTQPTYFQDVVRYRKALQQRNALLRLLLEARYSRRASAPPKADTGEGATLDEWTRQVALHGARVLAARAAFFTEIAPMLAEVHAELSGLDAGFSIEYLPGLSGGRSARTQALESGRWSAALGAALERDHDLDARRGLTQSGPHRDEISFRLDGIDLRRYGSQGQQRLAVLALKVALAHWVRESTGEAPILLLDDALSELDGTRRARLLDHACAFPQSVVTATDATFLGGVGSLYTVRGGQVESRPTNA